MRKRGGEGKEKGWRDGGRRRRGRDEFLSHYSHAWSPPRLKKRVSHFSKECEACMSIDCYIISNNII